MAEDNGAYSVEMEEPKVKYKIEFGTCIVICCNNNNNNNVNDFFSQL